MGLIDCLWYICIILINYVTFAHFSSDDRSGSCRYVTVPFCDGDDPRNVQVGQGSVKGEMGATGRPGKFGPPGPKGVMGPKGERGIKGNKGESAEKIETATERKLKEIGKRLDEVALSLGCYGITKAGVYTFDGEKMFCDGKRWRVIQRRIDGSVNFDRSFNEYTKGFGNLEKEFWTGLDRLNSLTSERTCILQFDMWDFNGTYAYARYSQFHVGSRDKLYKLKIEGYTGSAGDSMAYHNGMQFTTRDEDNDKSKTKNCAADERQGGWWYNSCYRASPNAEHGVSEKDSDNIIWSHWKGKSEALDRILMKMICI